MPEQSKFENVDLFASLEAIMKQNTGFYQSDLDIDKEIIAKAAASPNREDKTLLWFCRPSGTHCFRERDVFLKDTAPHNTWRFYMEQTSDRVLAYAIELTGTERGKIKGNLYELDYAKHYERVKEKELPADTVKLIYERGEREIPAGRFFNGNPDPQLGKFERFEALPDDPDALQSLLQEERRSREQLPPGDFKAHMITGTVSYWTTETNAYVRSSFPIRFSASGSGLRCFPPTGCSMRSFTRQGIRRNVPSAARSLRQPLTVSNTAPSAGSVSPADKPPSA